MRSHRRSLALATFCLTAIQTQHLLAFGGEGHQLIAFIAEERLTPAAKKAVKSLLDDANISDGEVASWADEIKRDRKETGSWHFVNIPLDSNGYNAKRDGRNGANVIDKIADFEKVLKDKTASKSDQAEALKYLVHFVGDIHQPLHCAERNGDRGGNSVNVLMPGEDRPRSLHEVWDTSLLRFNKKRESVSVYGKKLNATIKPDQVKKWTNGTQPVEWANECWQLAKDKAYAGVSSGGEPTKLTDKYMKDGAAAVDQQLQRGGVRLAAILNEVFK